MYQQHVNTISDGLRRMFAIKHEKGSFAIFAIRSKNNYFVQVSRFPGISNLRIEAVSNAYIPKKAKLTDDKLTCLRESGWDLTMPESNYDINFDLASEEQIPKLAEFILRTLTEIYDFKTTDFLEIAVSEH